mgnify:CR=1 FL=1
MLRIIIILIISAILVYLIIKNKYLFKSVIETLKINSLLRTSIVRILYRFFFRRF